MQYPNILRDALANTDTEWSKSDTQYAKGIVVGIVSCLMALGYSHSKAMLVLADYLPDNYNPEAIPTSWKGKEV